MEALLMAEVAAGLHVFLALLKFLLADLTGFLS
jgi:hypothetical protein